jgi:phage-related protein
VEALVPKTQVVFFREENGKVPLVAWLAALPSMARAKCMVRLERLEELGHELRRPEVDYLRDGIYELRTKHGGVNYRMLYFFHGRVAAVISHGITKQQAAVPPQEIEKAVQRKIVFEAHPQRHTFTPPED